MLSCLPAAHKPLTQAISSKSAMPSSSPTSSTTSTKRSSAFKERHPKFRRSAATHTSATSEPMSEPMSPSLIPSMSAAAAAVATAALLFNQHSSKDSNEEEGPLDMRIVKNDEKKSDPPPPPPYRYRPIRSSPPINPTTSALPSALPTASPLMPPPYPEPEPIVSRLLPPPPSYEVSTAKRPVKEITIITDSSADPLLDEHFRRSLGAKYQAVFGGDKVVNGDHSKDNNNTSTSNGANSKAEEEENEEGMDVEGNTVEDHFAKALGDTWVKLKEQESKQTRKTAPKPQIVAS